MYPLIYCLVVQAIWTRLLFLSLFLKKDRKNGNSMWFSQVITDEKVVDF